jgi:hypothetical protein
VGAEVVSIAARGHRADYSRVACGQVAAARQRLGLDHAGFARVVGGLLGWEVMPEQIAAWEDDVTPLGDVLLACSAAAHGDVPDAPLDSAPPAFHAAALAGHWVSAYQFTHAGQARYHADIALITASSGGHVHAVNHPPEPRSEGRARPFRNEIDARLIGRHLTGEWRNTSDTRYCGGLQLAVLPGEMVMRGWYTGVGSDIEVSAGAWTWVRLDPDSIPEVGLRGIVLGDPASVHDLLTARGQDDMPLTLDQVRGEP